MIEKLKDWRIQFLVLLVFIGIYIITKSPIVGVLTVLFIIFAFIVELRENAKEKGWKEEIKDVVLLFLGVFLLLKGMGIILNTEAPLSAIPTCSMEPTYHRGDVIVAAGWDVNTHYYNGSFESTPKVYYNNTLTKLAQPIWSYCRVNAFSQICRDFRSCPECFKEIYGDVEIYYSKCNRSNGEIIKEEICATQYGIKGKIYDFDYGTDTIIYKPRPDSLFGPYGLVVHRALFGICNSTECLYFTKGDNNNVFDFQYYFNGKGNPPITQEQVVGKVIFSIPYLGYPRVFLSGYVNEDPYCELTLR